MRVRRGLRLPLDRKNFLLLPVSFLLDHLQPFGTVERPPFDSVFKGDRFGARAALAAFLKIIALGGSLFPGKLFVNIQVEFLESHNDLP